MQETETNPKLICAIFLPISMAKLVAVMNAFENGYCKLERIRQKQAICCYDAEPTEKPEIALPEESEEK